MKEKSLLDLDSRVGKAPGGYNYPLAKTNMPFIFMNATGNLRDVETLVHEAGHAIHSFQMAPLKLNAFKNTPSEVAELASMSMELLSMDGWKNYFNDDTLLNRAKCEQLEGILGTLPWIATVDAFQHWLIIQVTKMPKLLLGISNCIYLKYLSITLNMVLLN
jgi:oligoendopeptidase F